MHILVTGGAGYIGSHTVVELLQAGHSVCVVDNLCNSSVEAIRRVEKITGKTVEFHEFDLRDSEKLKKLFVTNRFDAVIHFAGLKAVGESLQNPLLYYRNNLDSTLSLCEAIQLAGIKKLIFSSSATVYGEPQELPLTETSQTGIGITNPYGQTKIMIEQILRDLSGADSTLEITLLRYFNPVGAHESGLIGEDPNGVPNNLMPYISQVGVGKLNKVNVYGDDYDTPDGTGVRDYIHVVDLAKGHLAALEHMKAGVVTYNLGTGKGTSVLELVDAYSKASGSKIPYTITPQRPGDIAVCYASPHKANVELGWRATKTIADACRDTARWQAQNPHGYTAF